MFTKRKKLALCYTGASMCIAVPININSRIRKWLTSKVLTGTH
ncbi:hypothetical protein Cassandra_0381 [Pseudomonas phage Cassandra]|nr:hypothetical protein Cassandra_0381 [Pseudomonas phage Cassandra]